MKIWKWTLLAFVVQTFRSYTLQLLNSDCKYMHVLIFTKNVYQSRCFAQQNEGQQRNFKVYQAWSHVDIVKNEALYSTLLI